MTRLRPHPTRYVLAIFAMLVLGSASAVGGGSPQKVGAWEGPWNWPVASIHSCMLSSGKVLQWSHTGFDDWGGAWVIDIEQWTGTEVPLDRNLFCAGHCQLADGRILIVGGDEFDPLRHGGGGPPWPGIRDTHIFDPVTETWSGAWDMAHGRWYPTAITLPDGRVLVFSGLDETGKSVNPDVELCDPAEVIPPWEVVAEHPMPLYPRLTVMPDGNLFFAGPGEISAIFEVDTWRAWKTATMNFPQRNSGLCVPLGPDGSRILLAGGHNGKTVTATCEVIDLAGPDPTWNWTGSMAHPRMHADAVLLPDGQVLVVGGHSGMHEGATDRGDPPKHSVFEAELYDPVSESWSTMAPMTEPRNYHSTAILLQDARVLVSGDGPTAEIYSPPYLFGGDRPIIVAAPQCLPLGRPFLVATDDAAVVASISLVRISTVTHSYSPDQRLLSLEIQRPPGLPGALAAEVTPNANMAPPGYYMLFLLSDEGVPSTAQMVRIGTPVGDIDADGYVTVGDVLEVIAAWGPCIGCGADLDASGVVDVTDLLLLIKHWN